MKTEASSPLQIVSSGNASSTTDSLARRLSLARRHIETARSSLVMIETDSSGAAPLIFLYPQAAISPNKSGDSVSDLCGRADELAHQLRVRHRGRRPRDSEVEPGGEVGHDVQQVAPELADPALSPTNRSQRVDVVGLERALEGGVVGRLQEDLDVDHLLRSLNAGREGDVALDLLVADVMFLVEANRERGVARR
jgi:hypothetical protein